MNNEQNKGQNTKTVLPSRKISQWKKKYQTSQKRKSEESMVYQ